MRRFESNGNEIHRQNGMKIQVVGPGAASGVPEDVWFSSEEVIFLAAVMSQLPTGLQLRPLQLHTSKPDCVAETQSCRSRWQSKRSRKDAQASHRVGWRSTKKLRTLQPYDQ